MVAIEGLYIFDEHNNAILEHVFTGRPPSAAALLPAYLSHSAARSSIAFLANLKPPTLVCSVVQDRLLFLCPLSADAEPLLVLELLHRITDALEEFLGSPLLASKIDSSYDVVAQLVSEVCDAGTISTTEPNALREIVEAPNWMNNILGGFGLPAATPSLRAPGSLQGPASPFLPSTGSTTTTSTSGSAIPWRRANVKHTSNELYVDIVERLSVILAPSGQPLSATIAGNIVFTAKISGVPDLLLALTAPGGKTGVLTAMDLPCFHPCVRLARWRDKPGELSFVPPDGKFVLASYQTDLLPDLFSVEDGNIASPKLELPVSIETRSGQGTYGDQFEIRLFVKQSQKQGTGSSASQALNRNLGPSGRFGTGSGSTAAATSPPVEDIRVKVPISSEVRAVEDLKTSRGEAHYIASEALLEWRISSKEAATIASAGATLKCTIIGHTSNDQEAAPQANGSALRIDTYDYDENETVMTNGHGARPAPSRGTSTASASAKPSQQGTAIMPRAATLSFNMRGWLASGIKVDSLSVNTKTSKGLGAGVQPYKGVKYHTISRDGIEIRC